MPVGKDNAPLSCRLQSYEYDVTGDLNRYYNSVKLYHGFLPFLLMMYKLTIFSTKITINTKIKLYFCTKITYIHAYYDRKHRPV